MEEGTGRMQANQRAAEANRAVNALVVLLAAVLVGCSAAGDPPPQPHLIHQYIESVSSINGGPVFGYTEEAFPFSSNGPEILVNHGHVTCTNGGSVPLVISTTTTFSQLGIWVDSSNVAGAFVDRWLHATYPSPISTDVLVVTLPKVLTASAWTLNIAARNSSGIWGPTVRIPFDLLAVAGGDLQVQLHWDVGGDMDLNVYEPGGFRLSPGSPQSPNNGVHDLSSNEGCNIDGIQNENVGYGTAPRGTYSVELSWASCSSTDPVTFAVTVRRAGLPPRITIGSFLFGNPGTIVDTFVY